jgi:phage gp36-like protein
MAYCTQSDLLELISEDDLIQLTDDAGMGIVDSSVVDRAISDADAEIDSYCGTKYDVPFSPVPVMVRKLSVDISIYNLFARRRGAPEDRKERYNNAIRFLKDVSKGLGSLGADAPLSDDDAGPEATTSKSDRIFTSGRKSDGTTGSLDNY